MTELSAFDYELPCERIARYPAEHRSDSRLLVLRRATGQIRHLRFRDLSGLADAGDLLVVNDSRVFPARLLGRKPTGAAAEVLLLRPSQRTSRASDEAGFGDCEWEALVRPGGKLKPGRVVVVAPELSVRILDALPGGVRLVRLEGPLPVAEALVRFGRIPLPPYLERADERLDRDRYQTVYARHDGSVAAPTAGLHFDGGLLAALSARGVRRSAVTLHVGPGTFRPVEVEKLTDHEMHAEHYHVAEAAVAAHRRCRKRGGRVWAVGTTVVRTLESAWQGDADALRPGHGTTSLFIRPPFDFRAVDCLITNFHLPRSTLLMLVSAFGGGSAVRRAYRQAIDQGYRFYSYGDAMAIVP